MTIHLFNRNPSCQERGVCQRTGAQCHRACHLADTSQGEPPIGYEAALASNVHQLHQPAAELASSHWATPERIYKQDPWIRAMGALFSGTAMLCLLAFIALIGYSLYTPGSWLHDISWAVVRSLG